MINQYQSLGMSKEDATELFFEQAKNEAREKAWENRTPNQFALLNAKEQWDIAKADAKNGGKGGSESNLHLTRRQLIDYDLANKSNKWIKENPELTKLIPTIQALGKRAVETGTQEDADTMYEILDAIVERSARLASAIIAASVIKSGKGTSAALPVGIVCDGTTFYKTHNLQYRLRGYLNEVLISQRHLYFEILTIDNDITLGTAVAAC